MYLSIFFSRKNVDYIVDYTFIRKKVLAIDEFLNATKILKNKIKNKIRY